MTPTSWLHTNEDFSTTIPLACAILVYIVTPHRAGVGVFLNVRLAPLLALFAILVLRPPRAALLTRLGLAGAALATTLMSGISAREMLEADRDEMTGFDELLAKARRGARVGNSRFLQYPGDGPPDLG